MKTVTIQELRDLVAAKLGIACKADNFQDFKAFIDEIYSQFGLRWETLDDQAYRWHEINVSEWCIYGKTGFIQSAYREMDEKLGLENAEAECYDDSFGEPFTDPYAIRTDTTCVTYCESQGVSVAEMLAVLQKAAEKYNGEFIAEVGESGKGEGYCDLHLSWKVLPDKIEADHCYIEIKDDGYARLMDALYWLCECFFFDSFADFEKLNVELRYEVCEKDEESI